MSADDENNATEKKEEPKITLKTILKEDGVIVPSSQNVESLTSRGYGTQANEGLALTDFEALYLLSKGLIEVMDKKAKTPISFQQLLDKARTANEDSWVRYMIYRDLRSRGYVVREGFGLGIDFRVYRRGEYGKSTADFLVLGVKEGQSATIEDLARILVRVQSLKKTLILSVLNRRGEIVYYSLSRLSFQ
jgi:tRNA-intron endonuclease